MIRKAVYVMSLNYSGSTILALALSRLQNAYFVGEPALIYRKSGERYKHKEFCTPCKATKVGSRCPVWGEDIIGRLRVEPNNYWKILTPLLPAECEIIVDSSKDVAWIKRNLSPSVETYVIHISKPVHAWIASLKKKKRMRFSTGFHALQWSESFIGVKNFCKNHDVKYFHVNYEEFVTNYDSSMKLISEFIGGRIDPNQIISLEDFHYVKGNPGVNRTIATGGGIDLSKEMQLDRTWRDTLEEAEILEMYGFREVRNTMVNSGHTMPTIVGNHPFSRGVKNVASRLLFGLYSVLRK